MEIILGVLKAIGIALIIFGVIFLVACALLHEWIKRDPPEDWS